MSVNYTVKIRLEAMKMITASKNRCGSLVSEHTVLFRIHEGCSIGQFVVNLVKVSSFVKGVPF